MKPFFSFFILLPALASLPARAQNDSKTTAAKIIPGAERMSVYVPLLKGKRIAVFANQTSRVGNTNLVDTLLKLGISIKVIFGPEHGFRGTADAGEKVGNAVDEKTGIPIVSLYGSKKKPSAEDLKDVDILLFDIQDVGVRFYTYLASMEDYIETALEFHKPLLILDRPNPNGFYTDGPVLEKKFSTNVGREQVPIVYGMTIGEYAFMVAGEKWLSPKANEVYDYYRQAKNSADTPFHFLVIKCQNYDHKSRYILPVRPSPNLPDIQSIYLYPSTCFFEGTVFSEGRGTNRPFQVFGHPLLPKTLYSFVPKPNEGAKSSKHYGETCYGWNLGGSPEAVLKETGNKVQLKWLLEAYRLFPAKDSFFIMPKSGNPENSFFNKLAGNAELMQQIKEGKSEAEIRNTWEPALTQFKQLRKKYLLYPDYE